MARYKPIKPRVIDVDEPPGSIRVMVETSGIDNEFLRLFFQNYPNDGVTLSRGESRRLRKIITRWLRSGA